MSHMKQSIQQRYSNRRRAKRKNASLSAESLEDRLVLTHVALDLTDPTTQDSGVINGALFALDSQTGTGTGVINAFVRVQKSGSEQGYNTSVRDATHPEFDENTDPNFTRDLPLADVPIVEVEIDGVTTLAYEFLLDINETKPKSLLTLDDVEIYVAPTALANPVYPFVGQATPTYNMDDVADGDDGNYVLLDYSLQSGSGQSDMFLYVPVSAVKDVYEAANGPLTGTEHLYFYTQFGLNQDHELPGGEAAPDADSDDGFEEWAVRAAGGLGALSGFKFNDLNGDGIWDQPDEPGLAGWTIFIDTNGNEILDDGELSEVTDADGFYMFSPLVPGTYTVVECIDASVQGGNCVDQPNWVQTFPDDDALDPIEPQIADVLPDTITENVNFGNVFVPPQISLSGFKFHDLNANGTWDQPTEPPLENWFIYLDTNNSGGFDAGEPATTTLADGSYIFDGLPTGETYRIREGGIDDATPEPGWEQTAPTPTGFYELINQNESVTDLNFGNVLLPTLKLKKVTEGGDATFRFDTGIANFVTADGNDIDLTTDGGMAMTDVITLPVGTSIANVIEEGPPAGWELVGSETTGDVGDDDILGAGENVEITFTNRKLPTLKLKKVTEGGDATFRFDTGIANFVTADGNDIDLTTDGGMAMTDVITLPVGTSIANVIEEGPSAGWELVGSETTGDVGDDDILGAGENVEITFTNRKLPTLKLKKVTVGGDGTFRFDTGIANFVTADGNDIDLTTDGGMAMTDVITLPVGTSIANVVEEGPPAGWTLVGSETTGDVGDDDILGAGENVVITFTNSKLPTLKLNKVTEGGDATFRFDTGIANFVTADGNDIDLTTDGGMAMTDVIALPVGTSIANVLEEGPPAGWELVGSETTGDVGDDDILGAGENVEITFTNRKLPTLKLKKVTEGGDGTFRFDTGIANFVTADGNDIDLTTDGGMAMTDVITLPVGTSIANVIEEGPPAGWELVGSETTGDVGDDDILGAGENVEITFTNRKLPTLKLKKVTVGGDGTFRFDTGIANFVTADGNDIDLTTDGGMAMTDVVTLPVGTSIANVIEEGPPAGWELVGSETTGDVGDDDILGAGENVEITFTNRKLPTLKLKKVTVGGDGTFRFDTGIANFVTADGNDIDLTTDGGMAMTDVVTLPVGTSIANVVEEGPPAGWTLTSTVTDGDANDNDVLDAGEDVVITFTNQRFGSIHGSKFYDKAIEGNVLGQHDDGEPGVGDIPIQLWKDDGDGVFEPGEDILVDTEFTANEEDAAADPEIEVGQFWFMDLMPGSYFVVEVLPDGWIATTDTVSGPHEVNGNRVELGYEFGNIKRKDTNARTRGFWQNKHGRGIITNMELLDDLSALNLRDQAGDHADFTNITEWRNWLKQANAQNMAYQLSAQMAAMYLNIHSDFVDADDIVLVQKQDGSLTFLDISDVVDAANEVLGLNPDGAGGLLLVSGEADGEANASDFVTTLAMYDGTLRGYAGFLKNILDAANNDEIFIWACPPEEYADPAAGGDDSTTDKPKKSRPPRAALAPENIVFAPPVLVVNEHAATTTPLFTDTFVVDLRLQLAGEIRDDAVAILPDGLTTRDRLFAHDSRWSDRDASSEDNDRSESQFGVDDVDLIWGRFSA